MIFSTTLLHDGRLTLTHDCPNDRVLLAAAALQLTKYSLEPRIVFHIWRPVINESLMKHWFPKTGAKV